MLNNGALQFARGVGLKTEAQTAASRNEGCAYGMYRNTPVSVTSFKTLGMSFDVLTFHGKFSRELELELVKLFEEFKKNKLVRLVDVQRFAIRISAGSKAATDRDIASFADAVVNKIEEAQATALPAEDAAAVNPPVLPPVCEVCHTPENFKLVRMHSDIPIFACPDCADKLLAARTGEKDNGSTPMWKGLFLAFACSLVGTVLWVLLGLAGFIASISGLLIAAAAVFGYKKTGSPINKKALAALIALTLLVAIGSAILSEGFALFMSEEFRALGIGFGDSFQLLFEAVAADSEIAMQFYMNIGLGLVFTALGSYSIFWKMIRDVKQKNSGFYVLE